MTARSTPARQTAAASEGEWTRRQARGRGATSNQAGRFEPLDRAFADDGWGSAEPPEDGERLPTRLLVDTARSVITRNTSPDIGFERSINPYRGCEHGCIYCYARPSHAYLGLSPGLDFETVLFHKPDAPRLLAAELARPNYTANTVIIGSNTDPYQPVERQLELTRGILRVLSECRHPLTITTKSALVTRDIDILAPLAERLAAFVSVSITTLDPALARAMEPRASTPARRLEAVRHLTAAGIPVAVLASPMIPGLNDHELEAILEAAARAGASRANYILIRLPGEVAPLFEDWLRQSAPERADRVLGLIRDCRAGRLNDPRFGHRMRGHGPRADLLAQRFKVALRRTGLDRRDYNLDAHHFRPPGRATQGSLFDAPHE